MPFRGYFALNGQELINSSRTVAHLGKDKPTNDMIFNPGDECELVETSPGSGVYVMPSSSASIDDSIATPPNGAEQYDDSMYLVEECWRPSPLCGSCTTELTMDDTWPDLAEFLGDGLYRPELAPWYSSRRPESGEFGGIWVMDVQGFGALPVFRPITEMMGAGAAPGPHRDPSRPLTFEALVIACTSAGLEFGMEWLACQLRETKDRTDSVLRYFSAHPSYTAAEPESLVRELHGVVYTGAIEIQEAINQRGRRHQQATIYRVTWEMVASHPYAYFPQINLDVAWDSVQTQSIEWVHHTKCAAPETCAELPVLFSEECVPEVVEIVDTPPPSCGGCMPLCSVVTSTYTIPVTDYVLRCHETAVSLAIQNQGESALTLQGYFRICHTDEACNDRRFPVQVAGLPAFSTLILDGIRGRAWVEYKNRQWRPVGIISTPSGAPWRPAVIDRDECWEFVTIAPNGAEYSISMSLADREA